MTVVKCNDRFQEFLHCLLTSLLVHTRPRPSARIASFTRLEAAFWDRCFGPTIRTQDRLVAVKAFKLDVPPQTVARLADALRRLVDRPAIPAAPVRLLDAGLEGTRAFVAMEYAAGESIDVAWRQQLPMPIERALPILSVVADAIDAGWAQGLGHGALHPRDLFVVSGTDDIRLTGLGIVQALESIGEKAPARRLYAAPERVAAQPWGLAADVYSLGVIAHELLAGRRPSGAEQDGVLAPSLSPEARVRVRRVLAVALADRPEDRFASASALVEALGAAARGEALDLPVPRTDAQALAAAIVAVEAAALPQPVAAMDASPIKPLVAPPFETVASAGAGRRRAGARRGRCPETRRPTRRPRRGAVVIPEAALTMAPRTIIISTIFRRRSSTSARSAQRVRVQTFELNRPVAAAPSSAHPIPGRLSPLQRLAGLVVGGVAGYRLGLVARRARCGDRVGAGERCARGNRRADDGRAASIGQRSAARPARRRRSAETRDDRLPDPGGRNEGPPRSSVPCRQGRSCSSTAADLVTRRRRFATCRSGRTPSRSRTPATCRAPNP